jgi:hypothetical protein
LRCVLAGRFSRDRVRVRVRALPGLEAKRKQEKSDKDKNFYKNYF